MQRCREKKGDSQEWLNATLIPIPKKGYLLECDNWVGIALLDVVGKVLASYSNSPVGLAASVLPESQYGCRCSRSCLDIIDSAHQML